MALFEPENKNCFTYKFIRTHLPTGRSWVAPFTGHHHYIFTDFDGYPARAIKKAISETLIKWNRQQPNDWHYSIKI